MTGLRARMSAAAVPPPATPLHPEIAAKLTKLRNEKAQLGQDLAAANRRNNEQALQLRAATAIIAGARHSCEATCEHAQLAASRQLLLVKLQQRLDEARAVNEARDRAAMDPLGWTARQPSGERA